MQIRRENVAYTTKYTRINPGGTYRVPHNEAGHFEIKNEKNGTYGIWAPFINRLGMYEDLFGERQIESLNKEQKDRLAAYIRTL